jgi:hypothetical protein
LVLGLILLIDWLARFADRRARLVISLLHGLLVLLTIVILASALIRMRLYQVEFGLTELRFYTTAFMAWLAVVLVWTVVTVLPSHVMGPAGAGLLSAPGGGAGPCRASTWRTPMPGSPEFRDAAAGVGQPPMPLTSPALSLMPRRRT